MAETKLLILEARGKFGRMKRTDLFTFFTARTEADSTGGGGCLEGLPRSGGRAGKTFLLEKTGFSLSTGMFSSFESIWSLKYLSFLSTTLYGPQYS